jgi:multiple sugar transport system substrate-binding protein
MVAEFIADFEILPDLDDTIGGNFQATFWQQLRLMWVSEPISSTELDSILASIEAVAP